ncbi:MAG: molybdenum cofactor guanylyltransferase [Bacteroidales bacterium]|nr:molybdenum cofactor guanylyltransferase [Bacteroidales bacterium]MCF8388548.1 molybdenum cofactor guanylyltransferase [Bacteroidales bacterium]MCF8397331.1 molybdenum cofactor guanylyltransferase [Bacteroidales bacterium]
MGAGNYVRIFKGFKDEGLIEMKGKNCFIKKNQITGIILAGGQSRRMGMEKGLVELNGKPLIEYAIDVMKKVAGKILISSNGKAYDKYALEVVQDIIPDSGPMGGIYSCLYHSSADYNLVLSCDTPFVGPDLYDYLVQKAVGKDCVVPWHGGEHYEPLCALYQKKLTKVFLEFIRQGNYKIPDLLNAVKLCRIPINKNLSFYDEDLFFNINSREDLYKAGLKLRH